MSVLSRIATGFQVTFSDNRVLPRGKIDDGNPGSGRLKLGWWRPYFLACLPDKNMPDLQPKLPMHMTLINRKTRRLPNDGGDQSEA